MNYQMTNEDRLVLTTLTDQRYRQGLRTIAGIVEQTGLDETLVRNVLVSEHHRPYIIKKTRMRQDTACDGVPVELFGINMNAFQIARA